MRVKFKNNPSIGSRIRELREQKKISRNAMAENLGLSLSALQNWETSQTEPIASMIITLAEELGVEPSYLLTGEKNGDVDSPPIKRAQKHEISGVSMIDCFCSVNVSAGFGSFNEGITKPDGQEPYSDSLLQRLGVKAHNCGVFWARGTSMQPTIANSDQMLVDFSQKEATGDDKVYLVQNGDSVWVKRIKPLWDGIELISDNREEYEPIKIPADEAQNLQIIGQVVHIGHSLV